MLVNSKMKHLYWLFLIITYFGDVLTTSPLRDPGTCGPPVCEGQKKFGYAMETDYVYRYIANVTTYFHGTNFNATTLLSESDLSLKFISPCEATLQSDVNGDCVTSYTLIQPRNTGLILRRIKRLSSCSNRYKQHSVIQSTPYNFQSKYKSVPLMMSASVCKIVVDHNVYSEIACEESHLFQPFASHKRGAKTTVRQRLILLAENNATIPLPDQINRRFTLRFDHHQTPKPTSSELKTSRELIKSLCRLNADDVEEGFSYAFKKFIQTTRVLTYEALTQLYTRAPSHCAAGRKHVKNALPLLGTNAAISLMKDIILRNELTDDEVKDWLFSIALIPSPDGNTLAAVNPLLKYEKHSTETILAVSAVVHTYTKNHPEAENRPEVLEIVYHLENIAQSGCNTKKQAPDNIKLLTALKALGNIGVSTPLLNQTLQICVENDMLHLDERIAAIETHRRLPCDLGRNYLTQLFKDPSIDTELRIAAYLEVMRCPSYQLIRSIKEMLLTEEVNQVGSFIMSHLDSLQKSSMPSRVEIQGLLTDVDLKTKFSSDVRKFSQYFEKSMFHDGYNVGGNIEGSLVFSPKSYIPRSTTLNLTLDLFGESINMLEVTTRAEGFEYYIESLFGPSGRFNNKKVNEVLQSLRYKRQTTAAAAADTLQNEVHEKGEKVYNSQMQPKISLGVKIFGNELKYFNFLGDEKMKKLFNSLNPVQQLKNLLAENEITFEKSTMFLDSSYAVPTSVGLPIKLNAIGTAAVNFKTTGSFKAADFLNTGDLNVEGHIRPSIAVDVTGSMVVDAYYTETNIKIKSNIYSSAAVQCQAKIRGMDLISASFSLPKEKTEIFSAQSELLVQNELQDGIREGRSQGNLCTWDPVEQMLGLRFCLDYQFPNASQTIRPPTFLFTGPVRFNAYNTSLMSFVFDTPGSSTPRQFTTQLEINSKNRTSIQLVLQSAKTKWEAQGQYLNTPDDRHIAFSLLMNGSKQLTAELGVLRVEAKNGYIYSPRLYLAYNKTEVAKLTGSVRKEEKKGIAQWHVNLKVNVINGSTNITGYVKRTDTSVSANVTTNYQIKASKPERVRLAFEVKRKTGKSMEQAQGEIKIECTAYPYFNINGSAKYVRKQLSTDLKIELNGSIEDENRWMVALAYTDQRSLEARKLLSSIEIAKPKDKIDFKFAFDYHLKGPETDASARLRYAQGKEIYTSLYLKTPHANLRVIEGKLNVTLPSSTPMIINGTLKETIFNEYDVELCVTWFSGLHFKMKGSFHDKSTIKQSHYILKLILSSDSFKEISVTGKYSRDSTDFHIDLLVLQNNDSKEPYALTIKHATPSDELFETAFEIKYKSKVFSGTIQADLRQEKLIKIDLHIDNLNALLSYPGRTVKFDFEGAVKGLNYLAFVHFEWSPDSVIEITSNFVRVIHDDSQFVSLKTEFLSPFTNWKKTTFTMEWKMLTNMFQIESNVYWQKNQNINLNAFGRYEKTDDYFICQYNGTLLSSIDGPEQLVLMKSDWKIIRNEKSSNLTGRIDMISPFQDYSNGTLIGKVIIHDDAEIHGIADLKLENRNFRIDLDGHLKSLTENMLILNISTPIPDLFKFTARFGYSEKNRHFVAEIRGPKRAFGVEVLLNLKGIAEFDVILNLATPFEEFHKISLVGNSRNDSINLKAGFNKYDVGLSGMWFYEGLLNFEYNFQIFTPMPGYEISCVVAKLRKNEAALDFEISLQIADAKLGVKVQGSTKAPETLESNEKIEELEYDDEDGEKFYWSGQIQIDSILYPQIKGILHMEEINEVYDATLSLTLPEGTVEIKDQLGVVDFFNMKNHIQIKTPWESFSEMKSHYFFAIDDDLFFVDFNAKYKNQENWTELGIITLYNQTISKRDATDFRHVVFHLHSPLEMLKLVHLNMTYEKGLNMYRANFSGQAGNNAAELSFNLKEMIDIFHFFWICINHSRQIVKLRVVTPYSKFKTITVNVQLEQFTQPIDHKYNIYILFNDKEIQANGSLNLDSQKFEGFLTTTFEKNFKVIADYNKTEEGRTVYGVELHHDEKAYLFEGWSKNNEENVLELHGKLISGPKNLQDLVLEYSFKLKTLADGYSLSTQLQYKRDQITLDTEYRKGDTYIEINADMKTTLPGHSSYIFNGKAQKLETGNMTAEISLKTPHRNFENINLRGSCLVTRSNGACRLSYEFNKMKGFFYMDYVWLFEENMAINVEALMEKADEQKKKHYVASIFYRNENKSFSDLSFGLNYNKNDGEWQIGSNVTVLFTDFIEANIIIYLPDPYKETYKVLILRKNPFSVNDMILNVRFEALEADIHYGLQTQFQDTNKIIYGVFGIDTNIKGTSRAYSNVIDVKKLRRSYDITYILKTPYYVTDTLTLKLNHTKRLPYIVRSSLYYPETTYAAGVNFDYESLSNMNGTINSTTPIQGLDYTGLTLQVLSQSDYYKRFAMLFWPNNTALIRSDATYDTSRPETQVNGTLVIEIPVTSRHIGIIDYKYFMENSETRIGHTVVQYNSRNVLEAKLRSHGLVTRGLEKENIYLEIENQMAPIGVRYNHVLQYNPDILRNRLPKRETHRAEVFKLLYNILDTNLQHSSMLRVDPQSWLAYDLRVEDKTLDEETAEKHMEFNLRYPKRNVTLTGFYKLSAMKLTSEMIFYWDKNSTEKKVGAVVDWQKLSTKPTKQITSLSICHPSLEQDVKLSCELYADEKKMLDTKIDLVYSTDENKRLTIFGEMLNETNWKKKEYTLKLGAKHPATSLDMMVEGNIKGDGQLYQTLNYARYKRSYLPLQTGRAYAKLNIPEKSLEVESITPKERQYWKGWYSVAPPLYTVSYDAVPATNQNATGRFYLNIKEYDTALNLNSTEEGSLRNLHMRGNIPDARNAIFKIWRNYDGTLIPDVSFYLRLNHSRLITSKFIWRAELPEQLVAGYHKLSDDAWEGMYSTIDFWVQYIKSESMDAVYDIWGDAQPIVQGVLDDLSDIKDIENDMLLMCTYLNRSYHDNQFYIKDIVRLGDLLIDELSLRRHLENLPDVVNEIWAAMGESGESLRKSLIWFIETVKNTFEHLVEFLNKLMKGESTFEFTQLFDKLMESYDKFIKDLHLSFTVVIDEIMKYLSDSLREYWAMAQQIVAPTFLKLLHYAETAVWHAGEEVLDFFYEKQKEIQESPHYSKFAIFLRDLDAAWKDFTNNDAITNIQKYSTMFFNFAREKYIAIVPFGRELEDMMNDLVKELGELQKLSSIEWLYVRFDVTTKLKNIVSFFHFKIHELTQTALTAENNNRKAKTKFIFEPERGIIEFEQKLPISWHSFNEKPNFEEIPEYKAMVEIHNYFSPTNKSLWHYYNEYKPYADITNWLPPFKATDFLDNNVTIILKYQPNTRFEYHKILIIVDHNIIKVDLFSDMVQLNEKPQTILPFMIGNTTYVYQENKILKIENSYKGFSIECNMDFDICSVGTSARPQVY
ncbi:hypothetical protein B566_EDAN015189 [Ephemera danica]|nr:hypothetical protein B566_EDAN015189 [Ephemera danica]